MKLLSLLMPFDMRSIGWQLLSTPGFSVWRRRGTRAGCLFRVPLPSVGHIPSPARLIYEYTSSMHCIVLRSSSFMSFMSDEMQVCRIGVFVKVLRPEPPAQLASRKSAPRGPPIYLLLRFSGSYRLPAAWVFVDRSSAPKQLILCRL